MYRATVQPWQLNGFLNFLKITPSPNVTTNLFYPGFSNLGTRDSLGGTFFVVQGFSVPRGMVSSTLGF